VLASLPPAFAATRDALHALSEHVISAARYQATGRIGLRVTPGGFGTPVFDRQQLRLEGVELVHTKGGRERRTFMTTLREAADFVGVALGAPDVYEAVTHVDPDAPLPIDATSAGVLADWFAFGNLHLEEGRGTVGGDDWSEIQLWPEHFDLATDLGLSDGTRANFGVSSGDDLVLDPYAYVAPWSEARRAGFGQYAFGRVVTYPELRAATDAGGALREFFATAATDLSKT
jgi:hypothetical protein